MVFHGRPSRDCAPCRRRKTRCDLVPTGCSQCYRAKLICHGYRSPDKLIFRDETKNTVQKALVRQTANRLPSAPQWTFDESSRHAFLSLYVGAYSSGFDTLQPLLAASGLNGHLQVCLDAVGLAFMAFQLNRQDLIPLANQRYLRAIQRVGMVVQSSTQAIHNKASHSLGRITLQSVLLLDLYEKMAYQYYQLSACPGLPLSHIQGALCILQSLPGGELSNPIMQQLAARTIFAFTLSCGSAGIPTPEALVRVYNDLSSYVRGPLWTLIGILIDQINFRVDVRNGKLDLDDIVKGGQDLIDRLSHSKSKVPRYWWPQRRHSSDPVVFKSSYDIYPSHYATQVFSGYRMTRLGVCDAIQMFHPSAEVAALMTEDAQMICAAIPQFMLPAARSQNTLPFSPLQILQCSAELMPLYMAARYTQDPIMHAWILQTLDYMAENGIKLAENVANSLSSISEVNNWDSMNIVSHYAFTSA